MSSANVRFEWFQTLNNVTLTFYTKNKTEEDVRVEVTPNSLDITIVIDRATGQEYQHSINPFYGHVKPESLTKTIKTMKVELTLEKTEPYQWTTIAAPTRTWATTTPDPSTVTHREPNAAPASYPNSKGKDWSKVKLDPENEKEDVVGDPTNAFFKQIFSNGTDEQRRAMMKSFTESGGTVLSTNWQDVGNRHVTGEPPKGMEEKKWNE